MKETKMAPETPRPILAEKPKGGLVTMPFVIANEAFEKVASYGLVQNMIFYLMKDYHIGLAKGANILFLWSAATNFTPVIGAFVSDSYVGRFFTIVLGSFCSLAGTMLLWATAMIPKARPPVCDVMKTTCRKASSSQMALLYSSFALISVGAGGVRPCSIAFGADQLDDKTNTQNDRVLESFFGWYYASSAAAVLFAFTGIVYIQDRMGWKIGFGVPAIFMFFSLFLFLAASPLYIKLKSSRSMLASFVYVPVAAYRNRNLPFPENDQSYNAVKNSSFAKPSNGLRFLNKACVIGSSASNDLPLSTWKLCTVDQVEELKALIRAIPIWSTGIMLSINTSQSTFPILQASSMDRHVTRNFKIPAASFSMFTVIALGLWVVLYDRVILPSASRLRGKPVRISVKVRIGVGLLLSFLAMVVSGAVENVRRRRAVAEGLLNNPLGVVQMSAMWLVPQYCLHGLAEAFNAIGQTEFYYSEFPKSMSSIAACLCGLGMAVANLLASVILKAVHTVTSREGRESWVSDNLNRGRYDSYYWLLAVMSAMNVPYFLLCSWTYGPCKNEEQLVKEEVVSGNGDKGNHEGWPLKSMSTLVGKGAMGEDTPKN